MSRGCAGNPTGVLGTRRCAGNPPVCWEPAGTAPLPRGWSRSSAAPAPTGCADTAPVPRAGAAACAFPGTAGGGRTQQRSEQIPVYIAKICINMNIYLHVFLKGLLPEIYRWGSEVLVAGRYQLLQKKKVHIFCYFCCFYFFKLCSKPISV